MGRAGVVGDATLEDATQKLRRGACEQDHVEAVLLGSRNVATHPDVLTKSQVNKAGRTLRRAGRQGDEVSLLDYVQAREVLLAYRAAHRVPLTKATMGLRSMVRTEGCQVEVAQRLKRVPTIIDKLKREPTMQLANMQDVGGCRAILDRVDDVYRVAKRVRSRRPVERVYDYIEDPKGTGYRGIMSSSSMTIGGLRSSYELG